MEKFHGKYRIPSARWATWDYGSNAAYFVTICTAHRTHDFGAIHTGRMDYIALGQCAADCWNAIPDHFPFVILDGFVVMPNHVHGIVIINKSAPMVMVQAQNIGSFTPDDNASGNPHIIAPGLMPGISSAETETQNIASLPNQQPKQQPKQQPNQPNPNHFGPQSQNLASIIRGFKIGVTKFARQNNLPFDWQPRYHDHVIRDAGEHERIRNYILLNPQLWADDIFH